MQSQPLLKLVLTLTLAVALQPLQPRAEEEKPVPPPAVASETSLKTHNIGVGAGFLTGYGLTYRHWFPSKNGYQLAFIPVARVNDDETFVNTSMGAIGLRSFHQTRHTNFFGYYGGHYNFTYDESGRYYYDNNTSAYVTYQYENLLHNVFAGTGLGIEVHFWNLTYSLMFGYAANGRMEQVIDPYFDYFTQTTNPDSGKWKKSFQLQPSIESALFYSF